MYEAKNSDTMDAFDTADTHETIWPLRRRLLLRTVARMHCFGLLLCGMAMLPGCGVHFGGSCSAIEKMGVCIEYWGPSAENVSETDCTSQALSLNSERCPSADRIGTCLIGSLTDGKRLMFYGAVQTRENAERTCSDRKGLWHPEQ
jgi:hypothetical protein